MVDTSVLIITVLNSELRHCGVCTYAYTTIYLRARARTLRRCESPSIIRAGGGERAKVVLQYATERRHDIGESTDACVVARRLAAILESCQQTSHCALNP